MKYDRYVRTFQEYIVNKKMSGFLGIVQKTYNTKNTLDFNTGSIIKQLSSNEQYTLFRDKQFTLFYPHQQTKEIQVFNNPERIILINGEVFIDKMIKSGIPKDFQKEEICNDNYLLPYIYGSFGEFLEGYLYGNYNILVYEKKAQKIIIFNCTLGMVPLYFYEYENDWVVSSELMYFCYLPFFKLKIDKVALMEYLLFHYPLRERTFFQNVNLLKPATKIIYENNIFTKHQYFDHRSFFCKELIKDREALEFLNIKFKEVVNTYIPSTAKYALSLTGGFDGRTILSVIENYNQLLTYTFGTSESSDISTAKEIADVFNLNHRKYFIENEYYKGNYNECAEEFILRSNGLATFERAHYINAFKKLSKEVEIVLSGNCGSEIFRALHSGGAVVSQFLLDLLFNSKNYKDYYSDYINSLHADYLFNFKLEGIKDQLIESYSGLHQELFSDIEPNRSIYLFLLKETFRKYFGIEMKVERIYAHNRSPYLDRNFLIAVNKTPFSSAYQSFGNKNPFNRRKGQLTYSYIIEKNNPKLSKIKTNKGYSPHDVYRSINSYKLIIPYFMRYLKKPENAFNVELNARTFYMNLVNKYFIKNPFINFEIIKNNLRDNNWKVNNEFFAKLSSWSLWYNQL
jgi:asparagine synthase (glutamine-hydrolysing)